LREQRVELQAAVRGSERRQAADRLRELAFRADPPAAAGLVPGDRDMDEALVEVPLLRRSCPPGDLELLVRSEVVAGPDERDALFEVSTRRRRREAVRALPVRPSRSGSGFDHRLSI